MPKAAAPITLVDAIPASPTSVPQRIDSPRHTAHFFGMQTAYHRPKDLSDALGLLAKDRLVVAAGCTDLFPATTAKALPGPILDITAITALRGISQDAAGWRIGAATTWTDLLHADLPPAFDALRQAAREVGSAQIQNAGTLAGNLCTASPAGDGIPCLLAVDASIELASTVSTRTLPLGDFLIGARQTALRPGELLTAIVIPASAGIGTSQFLKLGARKYLVISIAMVAARLVQENGVVRDLSVAIGACSATAQRMTGLETACQGASVADLAQCVTRDRIAAHLAPIDDIRADAEYRIDAACELTRRVLSRLSQTDQVAA